MPYQPHTLITFGGSAEEVAADDEIWQCGVRGGDPVGSFTPVAAAQLGNLLAAIQAGVANWFAAADSHHSPSSKLRWLKAANIGADGKYTDEPAIYTYGSPVPGSTTSGVPSFCTVAISWTTGGVGRRGTRGRIYPPNYGTPIAASGSSKVDPGVQSLLVAQGAELLTALSANGSEFAWRPYVISEKGPYHAITGVRVGNVYDVQRRRKNAVAETYDADEWIPPALPT